MALSQGYSPISSPIAQVRQLQEPRLYPRILAESEIGALLREARSRARSWTGKRNWTMLLTLIDAMLRLHELIGLELADVNLQARSIRVRHAKGDKERVVFMGRRLTQVMREWLAIRGHVAGTALREADAKASPVDRLLR